MFMPVIQLSLIIYLKGQETERRELERDIFHLQNGCISYKMAAAAAGPGHSQTRLQESPDDGRGHLSQRVLSLQHMNKELGQKSSGQGLHGSRGRHSDTGDRRRRWQLNARASAFVTAVGFVYRGR